MAQSAPASRRRQGKVLVPGHRRQPVPHHSARPMVVGAPAAACRTLRAGSGYRPPGRQPRPVAAAAGRPPRPLSSLLSGPSAGRGWRSARPQRGRGKDTRLSSRQEIAPRPGDELMKDLRSEIRAAFEEDQAKNPPAPDLRQTIVRSATTQPAREARVQLIAVFAALVIAALVVAGLLSSRLTHNNVPARATATPSEAPPNEDRDYGPPPAGVPLFYLQSPTHPGWYIGFDWSGHPRGTIKLPPLDPSQSLFQSYDGSSLEISQSGKTGVGAELLDRLGNPISGASGQIWADDNQHMCSINFDQRTHDWTLVTGGLGQEAKNV